MQQNTSQIFIAVTLSCLSLSPLACANAANAGNAEVPLRFEDFPAESMDRANKFASHVSMGTAHAKRYRTVISTEGQKEPNFAGHYRLVTWGCGTDCRGFAIVDRRTGVARTIKGAEYVAGAMGNDQPRIDFRPDSRLLILNGLINDTEEGSFFYEWTGKGVRPLLRLPLAKEDFSEQLVGNVID